MKNLKFLHILFFVALIFSCSSSENSSGDEVSETTEKLLKKYSKEINGQIVNSLELVYDGNKVVEVLLPLNNRITYTYENDLLVLEQDFDYSFSNQQYDIFDDQTTFQYENGVLVSDKEVYDLETGDHNKHKYTLSPNGKIVQYDYFHDGDINSWPPGGGSRIFTFNQENVVSESQTNVNEDEMFRIERTFDDKKNPLLNSNIQSKRQFWALFLSPMSDNNMINRNSFDENNELYSSLTYSYEYNDDGYPIKRMEFDNLTNQLVETILFEYY